MPDAPDAVCAQPGDDDPIVAAINRPLVVTPTGRALLVTDELFAALIEYVVAVEEHRDASQHVLALAHAEPAPADAEAAHRRIVFADDCRDQRARELADELLTALGIPS